MCVSFDVNCNEEDGFTHKYQGWFVNSSFFLCVYVCVVEMYWSKSAAIAVLYNSLISPHVFESVYINL